jgi:hypothetical protein
MSPNLPAAMDDALERERRDVMADTVAQTVFNNLEELFREQARFRGRWIWELMQNARDASPQGGVSIKVISEPHRLLFTHDGLPFSKSNIAHLIYHGTTKRSADKDGQKPIGQFGTGFLATHLLSKTVQVRGQLEDGANFDFVLDRRGDAVKDIRDAMNKSWSNFKASLHVGNANAFATQFEYPLSEKLVGIVEKDVSDLIDSSAYLLAFNKLIAQLQINCQGKEFTVAKVSSDILEEATELINIKQYVGPDFRIPEDRYIAVISNSDVSVGIELTISDVAESHEKQWTTVDRKLKPHIFKAFPLYSTGDFALPLVINSEKFEPRVQRDTIMLKRNLDGDSENMRLIADACDLAIRTLVFAAKCNLDGATVLATLNSIKDWDWVDSEWLRTLLLTRFIEPLRLQDVLETVDVGRIAPAAAAVPIMDSQALCCELWDVAADLAEYADRLPRRSEAYVWSQALSSWALVRQKSASDFEESLTAEKLCKQVADCQTVDALGKHLSDETGALSWLNKLYALLHQARRLICWFRSLLFQTKLDNSKRSLSSLPTMKLMTRLRTLLITSTLPFDTISLRVK